MAQHIGVGRGIDVGEGLPVSAVRVGGELLTAGDLGSEVTDERVDVQLVCRRELDCIQRVEEGLIDADVCLDGRDQLGER